MGTSGRNRRGAVRKPQDIFPLALKLHLHEGDYPAPAAFFTPCWRTPHKTAGPGVGRSLCHRGRHHLSPCPCWKNADATSQAPASSTPPSFRPRPDSPSGGMPVSPIVTQPHFIAERGNAYLQLIFRWREQDDLYRCATLKIRWHKTRRRLRRAVWPLGPMGRPCTPPQTRRAREWNAMLGRDERALTPEQATRPVHHAAQPIQAARRGSDRGGPSRGYLSADRDRGP